MNPVREAALILDKIKPGWHQRITEPLNLRSCSMCVLGQVYRETEDYVDSSFNLGYTAFVHEVDLQQRRGLLNFGVFGDNKFLPDWNAEINLRKQMDLLKEERDCSWGAPGPIEQELAAVIERELVSR